MPTPEPATPTKRTAVDVEKLVYVFSKLSQVDIGNHIFGSDGSGLGDIAPGLRGGERVGDATTCRPPNDFVVSTRKETWIGKLVYGN